MILSSLFCNNRSAENTQIPSPWVFFMGSHRSTHDSGIKRASYYSFKKLVGSPPRVAPRSNIQCSWMQQWQCTVKCWCDVVHARYVTLFCCVKFMSHHVITSWCVENGAWFICVVFWLNHDMKSCLAYGCIRRAGLSIRYDIENGALLIGWYTEMPPLGKIVDLGPAWPRSTMFPWGDISVYHPPWRAPFS
jgi:hypothetical protein